MCNRELLALCTGALQKKEGGTWSVHPLVQVDSFCMHKQAVRCLRIITARAACPRTLGDGYLIVANGMTTWEDFNTSGLMTTTRDHLRYSEDGLGAHRFTEYFVVSHVPALFLCWQSLRGHHVADDPCLPCSAPPTRPPWTWLMV